MYIESIYINHIDNSIIVREDKNIYYAVYVLYSFKFNEYAYFGVSKGLAQENFLLVMDHTLTVHKKGMDIKGLKSTWCTMTSYSRGDFRRFKPVEDDLKRVFIGLKDC
jgi:hypothetical protein